METTTVKKTLTNSTMHQYLISLNEMLSYKGVLGYAIARNVRALQNGCQEYIDIFSKCVAKYGVQEKDEDGNFTGRIKIEESSGNVAKLNKELAPYVEIKHSVELYMIPFSEAYEQLSAAELLQIDFMLFDEDKYHEQPVLSQNSNTGGRTVTEYKDRTVVDESLGVDANGVEKRQVTVTPK